MIKIENVVLPSNEQMEFVIMAMRNPLNSWARSDSFICDNKDNACFACEARFALGNNDHDLMCRLAKAGTDHRKYLRMMPVFLNVTAPLYWWKEADTYKVGTVCNSCSTMHKIQAKEFTLDDFSHEHLEDYSMENLNDVIMKLNFWREIYLEGGHVPLRNGNARIFEPKDKDAWWQLIQLLPSSYNQKRSFMVSYEVLANMYKSRVGHKLDEWRVFCKWIESLPYSELIINKNLKENVV